MSGVSARRQTGFTMIEVLVTFIILLVGLLGLIGLQARAQQSELESYQRGQALVLLQDILDRMNANRIGSKSGNYLTTGLTPAYVGNGATPPTALSDCSALTGPALDLCEWGNELIGAAEVTQGGTCTSASGANCVGAMIGARGWCLTTRQPSSPIAPVQWYRVRASLPPPSLGKAFHRWWHHLRR